MSVRRVALLVLGLVSLGCARPAPPPATPALVAVRTVPVVRERVIRPIRAAGRLWGKQEMALAFRSGGTVDRILVREGQAVRQGQVLATLDTLDADAALVQATAAYEKAERDRARIERLAGAGAVARVSLQDAETAVELSRAALRQARHARVVSELRAPDDGQVQRRLVEAHEQVGPGTPVLLVRGATRGWVVKLGLSDRDAVQVRLGDSATVRFDAFPDRIFPARVTEIAGGASPQTGTFEVEVAVDPAGDNLLSGLVAKVEIVPAAPPELWAVPVEALVEGSGRTGAVYTVSPGDRARRVPVTIGFIEGPRVTVLQGLDQVTEVVTDGAPCLRPGQPVARVH
ncbi:MAG TPA: efflux RND transporter periplasmic adaptor subunit [Myxococcaceae bacterium]|nr:efflux RND transporter periplasmic adaptor subunit [Myxococcaceae bacterium]